MTTREIYADGKHGLAIPNESIRRIFVEQVGEWFSSRVAAKETAVSNLRLAFCTGDGASAQAAANELLIDFVSARDYSTKHASKESFYHGLLLGALVGMQGWHVMPNAESGFGFWDISARNETGKEEAFIIEIKYSESRNGLVSAGETAIGQIHAKQYWRRLKKEGASKILLYGAAFHKKECCILSEELMV
ncbi:MAG: PD-(D/E)XK nuclease domain-containing protein [Eubacteriaceae bacterium]|nr:PD-(D/E)XK nuclease domain-containing protein [Eubacteriaceae bacterium]